ncbi:MAG: hypothetical protein Q8O48_00045, partial [Anaerolineales bacterium]|nr:hypothetical protein [Anaerolineales bacterium]
TVRLTTLSPFQNMFGFSPDGRLFAIADGDGVVHILHSAASSDNGKEDVLIPTLTPMPTSPSLSTNTPAPTAAIESTFPDLKVIKTDSFDDPNNSQLRLDPSVAKIENGVLQFIGRNWTGGVHYDPKLQEGQGIIINFKYTQDSEFEMLFENGGWNTDTYKRFGVYIVNDRAETNIWQGKTPLGQTLKGSLDFSLDTWYSLLLVIRKNNEFYARIWNPENPAQTVEYKNTFGAAWSDLSWTFKIGANNGTILFDDFKELQIK